MAISTNGAIITRVTSALYGEYLSNASYTEVSSTAPATLAASFLSNDFAGKTDLQIATTMLTNLGLTSITGLDNWLSAQLTAAGSTTAAKGAKVVSILNDYANLTSDATYGSYATAFNAKVAAGLVKSQTTGSAGGAYATADAVAVSDSTFTLTTSTDTITGGAGNDTLNAPLAGTSGTTMTFSASDAVNGGAGTDTLYVESSAATLNLGLVTNVENIKVNTATTTAVTLASDKLMKGLELVNTTGAVTFSDTSNADTALTLTANSGSAAATIGYKSTALAGAADNLAITLNSNTAATVNVTGATTTTNVLEKVTLNSVADSTVSLALGASGVSSVVVTGAGSTTIASLTETGSNLKTIDGSAATGALSVTAAVANSTVTGGSANDTLTGSSGNDVISSGAGNDSVNAAAGNDSVDAGAGNDVVTITSANLDKYDTLAGGEGTDTLDLSGTYTYVAATSTVEATNPWANVTGFETVRVSTGNTASVVLATGLAAGNTIATANVVGTGSLTMTGDTTVSTINFTAASAGDSGTASIASAGAQTVNLSTTATYVTPSLTTKATSLTVNSGGDTTTSANTLALTATALTSVAATGSTKLSITAGSTSTAVTSFDGSAHTGSTLGFSASSATGAITATAGSGAFTVTTGAGADVVTGSAKADTITTGAGNDTITGAAGNDTINPGAGSDSVVAGDGDDTVTQTSTNTGADYIDGGAGNDALTGGAGADTLVGGAGNDTLTGNDGADSLIGGEGNDTISDGAGNDKVYGGEGDDAITLGAGTDYVEGGAGNDTITTSGLSAGDSIDGGDGTDSLVVTNTSSSTVRPVLTSVESLTISTSAALTLNLADLQDALTTSLSVYGANTTGDATARAVTVSSMLNGSTLTVSDDYTSDYASTTDTDNDGNLGALSIDAVDGGSLSLAILPNVDSSVDAATTLAVVTLTDVVGLTVTSSGGSSDNLIQHTFSSLAIDATDTTSLTVTAGAYSGVSTGDVTSGSAVNALESISLSGGAGSNIDVGAVEYANNLATFSATAAGTSATTDIGAVGATSAAALTSITAAASAGGVVTVGDIAGNTAAITTLSLTATGRSSAVNIGTISTDTKAITTLTVSASDFGTIAAGAVDTVDTATITTANLSVNDDSILSGDFSVGGSNTAAVITTLNATFGSRATYTGQLELETSTIGTANITIAAGSSAVSQTTANADSLLIGGSVAMNYDVSDISSLTFTSSGTGAVGLNLNGDSFAGASTVTSGSGNDTIYGGSSTDRITTGIGADSINGGAGADTISAGAGLDTILGGTGIDSMTGGDGIDRFQFSAADTDVDITAATDIITDFASGTDNMYFYTDTTTGVAGSSTNYTEVLTAAADLATFAAAASTALNATIKYYFGVVGTDGYLAFDDDGTGVTQIIKLTGVTDLAFTDITGGAL